MKEYQKRIQEHEKRLPHLREKIAAAIVLFIVASLMLTVVTFAWLTLSVAPEVSDISMSIAANGSLEIALAHEILRDADGNPILDENGNVIPVAPGASQVGDSNLELLLKNRTWGNLVNLSDPSYGLENIVLRPATLNTSSLLSQPLYAATYTSDGRISSLRSDFAYAQWNSTLSKFEQSSYKGIKAISSVEFDEVEYEDPLLKTYALKIENIEKALEKARSDFNAIATDSNMTAINGIMTTYMNGTLKVSSENKTALEDEPCTVDDIQKFHAIMLAVYDGPMQTMGEAFMEIIELYQLDTYGQNNSTDLNYEKFTDLDKFCAEINAYLAQMNADRGSNDTINFATSFPNLSQYLSDRAQLKAYIDELALYKDQNTSWGDIDHIVNWVVDINTTEINGKTIKTLTGSLSQYASELLGMIGEGKANQNNAVVKNGLMYRLEKMLHNGADAFKIPKATIYIDKASLKTRVQNSSMSSMASMVDWVISGDTGVAEANIRTSAPDEVAIGTTRTDVKNAFTTVGAQSVTKTYVAKDTYGLSVDFWIRTNAANSFLTLQGEVRYDYEDVIQNIVVTDSEGNQVTHENMQIYLATVTTTTKETGKEDVVSTAEDQEVYQLDNVWYYLANNQAVVATETLVDENNNEIGTLEVKIDGTPEKKQNKIITGYSGANRIWTEEELDGMSEMEYRTTQGAGSCYTFYADPAEAEQIMEILAALKIAFVDADGNYIGGARLATELCFSEYGKHTVPIVLEDNCMGTGTYDEEGNEIRAITQLEKNTPTLITALIYLDGTVVSNDKVLSSSEIEGRFNIQFGSTDILEPIENEGLMGDEIRVSGGIVGGNPTVDFSEDMEKNGYKVNVSLNISGSTPTSVYAYFLRKISETQGTKQEKLVFNLNTNGEWVAEMTFNSPGEYILRSVIVDGIERELEIAEGASEPTVTINGFSCTNFHGINGLNYTYRTASSYVNERFYVTVAAKDENLIPKSVEAIFMGDNGKSVTVHLTDSDGDTQYEGLASFQSSGTYTCQYLLVDGDYYELATIYTREIYTGLKVQVWLSQADGDTAFTEEENMKLTDKGYTYIHKGAEHKFNIQMRIYDSEGEAIEGLTNVIIKYSNDNDATLVWNSSSRYYVGQLPTIKTPGAYTFESVEVGNEIINSARSAMSITAIPSDPVSYVGLNGAIPTQVIRIEAYTDKDSAATVSLEFKNADAAAVFGKFSRTYEGGTEYYILKATTGGTDMANYKTFTIPDLDGVWKLEEVKMSLVYDGTTKTFFMGDDSLEALFEGGETYVSVMSAGENPVDLWATAGNEDVETEQYYLVEGQDNWTGTTVVKTMHSATISTSYSGHKFMEPYALNDKVTIDHMFDGVAGVNISISNVKLTYDHSKTDTNVSWSGDANVANIVKSLAANGKDYTMPSGSTLNLPGTYNVTMSYDVAINGETITVTQVFTDKQFTLSYTMPTVEITGITPTNTYSYDTSTSPSDSNVGKWYSPNYQVHNDHKHQAFTSSYDSHTATVYFKCFHTGGVAGTTYGSSKQNHYHVTSSKQADGTYGNPTVTITLSGMGTFASATLNFNDNTNICTDTTYTAGAAYGYHIKTTGSNTPYKWTSNSSVTRYIGQVNCDTTFGGGYSRTVAGTITAETLSVVVDGTTYTIKIPKITINNNY